MTAAFAMNDRRSRERTALVGCRPDPAMPDQPRFVHFSYTSIVNGMNVRPMTDSSDPAGSDTASNAIGGTCHEPVHLVPMERSEAERIAKALKAVADPTRLQLLGMLQASPGGEACVCDLTAPLGLTQPTVSHHLKILADAELIARDKRGTWVWYTIIRGRLDAIRALLA